MKVMKLRPRNTDNTWNGPISINQVKARQFRKNNYTHVRVGGELYTCRVTSGILWLDIKTPS